MDTRDSKSLKIEAEVWMEQLAELTRDLDTRHDVNYGYLKEVVGHILKKTKDRASALLRDLSNDRDTAKAHVTELQNKLAHGKRHGFESKEAFETLVDEIRKSLGQIPIKMMSLDPTDVHSAIDSFQPTFTKYRPPPASVTTELCLAAGMELQCRADAAITENAEFWAQVASSSADVERELFNAALSCRLRHLTVGRNASFADRPNDVTTGLKCWAIVNGVYYRAIVENIKEQTCRLPVEVRSVDYGYHDAVRYEDLIPYAEYDSIIPCQTLRFRLYGASATKLPRQARWDFADAVKEKLLTAQLHSLQTVIGTDHPVWEVTVTADPNSGTTINASVLEKARCCTAAQPKVHTSSDIRLLDPETAAAAGIQKVVAVLNKKETPTSGETVEKIHELTAALAVSDASLLVPATADGDASSAPGAATDSSGAEAISDSAVPPEKAWACTIGARTSSKSDVPVASSHPASVNASPRFMNDTHAPALVDGVACGDSTSGILCAQRVGLAVNGCQGGVGENKAGRRMTVTDSTLLGNFGLEAQSPGKADQKSSVGRDQLPTDETNSFLPAVTVDPLRRLGARDQAVATAVTGSLTEVEPALAAQATAGRCVTNAEYSEPFAILAAQPQASLSSTGGFSSAVGLHPEDHAGGRQCGKWRSKDRATDRRALPPQDSSSSYPSRSWSATRRPHGAFRTTGVISAFGDTGSEPFVGATNVDGKSSTRNTDHRSHPQRDEGYPTCRTQPAKGYRTAGQLSAGGKRRNSKWTDGGRRLPSYPADRVQPFDATDVLYVSDTAAGVTPSIAVAAAAADAHASGAAYFSTADAAATELLPRLTTMDRYGSSAGETFPPEAILGDRCKAAAVSETEKSKAGGRTRPRLSGDSKATLQALLQLGSGRRRARKTGANDEQLTTDCEQLDASAHPSSLLANADCPTDS